MNTINTINTINIITLKKDTNKDIIILKIL